MTMDLALSPKEFYKFCPRCGADYSNDSFNKSRENLRCEHCQYTFYHNPKAAVNAIVINDKEEVLLARRAYDPAKGTWDLPGGFVDWGEDPITALEREMKEELHVKFSSATLFSTFHTWYPFDGLNISLVVIVYKGSISGKPQSDDDVSECKWFSLNEIPTELAFPQMRGLLESLKKEIAEK